jgi:hypothetical protein
VAEGLLRAVSHPANQAILGLLAVEPCYPRRIGALLGLSETEVARRVRRLENLGLVQGRWDRVGRNVKLYRLAADGVVVRFTKAGVEVAMTTPGTGRQPSAAALAPTAASDSPSIPQAPELLGRDAELRRLDGPEPSVLVLGMAGIGKTALLARYAAHHIANRPVFWRSFRGVESMAFLANQIALFLAQHGDQTLLAKLEGHADPLRVAEATLHALKSSGAIFVLDDIHRVQESVLKTFLNDALHLEGRPAGGKVILASREWVAHNPARPGLAVIRLEGLADADACAMLERSGLKVAPELVARLKAEVGGHPLGLSLLAQAAQQAGGLEGLLDRVPERDLENYLLGEIHDALLEEERLALAHGSLFRTAFTAGDVSAISGRKLESALARLRRRMLVSETLGGFSMHETVQNFFYSRLEDKPRLHARVAEHYLVRESIEGRLEAMHHFLQAKRRDRVLELLEHNLDLREFDFIDAGYQRLYLSILELFPQQEVKDDRRWALIQDEKGDIHLHRGDGRTAMPFYVEALEIFKKIGDKARVEDVESKMDLAQKRLKEHAPAPRVYHRGPMVEFQSKLMDKAVAKTAKREAKAKLKRAK